MLLYEYIVNCYRVFLYLDFMINKFDVKRTYNRFLVFSLLPNPKPVTKEKQHYHFP